MGLLGELPQEESGHGAAKANVDLADATFGLGVDLLPELAQALVQTGDVFLIARQAVESLGHQDELLPVSWTRR